MSKLKELLYENKSKLPNFKSPENLLIWLSNNIEYAWMDKDYKKYDDFGMEWWDNYRLLLPDEIVKYGVGTCFEQALLAKQVFDKDFPDLETKLIFLGTKDRNDHLILIYKRDDMWFWFEHSFEMFRGIHGPYGSNKKASEDAAKAMKIHDASIKEKIKILEVDPKDYQTKLSGKEFYKTVGWKKDQD